MAAKISTESYAACLCFQKGSLRQTSARTHTKQLQVDLLLRLRALRLLSEWASAGSIIVPGKGNLHNEPLNISKQSYWQLPMHNHASVSSCALHGIQRTSRCRREGCPTRSSARKRSAKNASKASPQRRQPFRQALPPQKASTWS